MGERATHTHAEGRYLLSLAYYLHAMDCADKCNDGDDGDDGGDDDNDNGIRRYMTPPPPPRGVRAKALCTAGEEVCLFYVLNNIGRRAQRDVE